MADVSRVLSFTPGSVKEITTRLWTVDRAVHPGAWSQYANRLRHERLHLKPPKQLLVLHVAPIARREQGGGAESRSSCRIMQ